MNLGFDPTQTVTLAADQDSWLKEASPGGVNFGQEQEPRVSATAGSRQRAVYRFQLSAVPANSIVLSARVYFFSRVRSRDAVYVHRITDSWTEAGVTWTNTASDFDAVADGTFTPNGLNKIFSADVTAWCESGCTAAPRTRG